MISRDKKFIFIHIPKTGGNSIQSILLKYANYKIIGKNIQENNYDISDEKMGKYCKHATLSDHQKYYNISNLSEYFVFTVIRNPWDRILSMYTYRTMKENFNQKIFKRAIFSLEENKHSMFEGARGSIIDKNILDISKKIIDYTTTENKVNGINFFIRFENLEEDFKKACELCKITQEKLPFLNKSIRENDYRKYYTKETKEVIERVYKEDIDYFNFKF